MMISGRGGKTDVTISEPKSNEVKVCVQVRNKRLERKKYERLLPGKNIEKRIKWKEK